jgi:hypothetical protein
MDTNVSGNLLPSSSGQKRKFNKKRSLERYNPVREYNIGIKT